MTSTNKSLNKMLLVSLFLSIGIGLSAFSAITLSQANENIKTQQNITAKPAVEKNTERELSMLIPGNKQFNLRFLNHLLINNTTSEGR
ncbi:hypothetical protein [Colwellia sp. E2M01]|uniref:hypothetical protein n=1 Tax=Colwellia sp. E2M01 TaxID=2841561 RepID=UPI001C08AD45|nr:hypothetical protein [Colwellia sp. E2M01]MBU2870389.1 hypothetical protein [Colwellia sp. E2M01]